MTDPLIAATDWYVRINSGDLTEAEMHAFQHWKEATPENGHAWDRIKQIDESFDGLEPIATKAALQQKQSISLSRRHALKKMSVLMVAGSTGFIAYRKQPWQTMLAEYSTEKGTNQTIKLPDQTMVVLNTDTAIDTQYDENSRTIKLIKGEILVETGHGLGSSLPFRVQTKHGVVSALGTRFSVRLYEDYISINVFKDSVRINNVVHNQQKTLTENQSASCGISGISENQVLALGSDLWIKGILVVTNMPLKTFLAEINRYHNGFLRCDPDISNIAVSGSFPLKDMQAILNNLQNTYPIKVESITQYWITVKPA